MTVERYAQWVESHGLTVTRHDRWLHIHEWELAVVVTITPPLSRNATTAALLRVTDCTLPILVESFNTPYGEYFSSHDTGNERFGVRTWIVDGDRIRLARPARPT